MDGRDVDCPLQSKSTTGEDPFPKDIFVVFLNLFLYFFYF